MQEPCSSLGAVIYAIFNPAVLNETASVAPLNRSIAPRKVVGIGPQPPFFYSPISVLFVSLRCCWHSNACRSPAKEKPIPHHSAIQDPMSFCYVEKLHPHSLSPASLDWYLAKGWYRMGQNIFTTHFLCFKTQLYSAIWIRLRLSDFQFSKSQRKLLAKNAQLFEHRTAYRKLTQEKEILYHRYASDFNGRLSPSLRDSLEDYDDGMLFNTYELSVRQKANNELIAASYFDLGQASAASILGIYEPSMKEYSLGYYTMLLEIQFCLDNGFEYYYPGYVVPGYQRFDYKLRLGPAEYYDLKTDQWLAFADFNPQQGPAEIQRSALQQLEAALRQTERGSDPELCIYPLFEAPLYHIWQAEYIQYPYLLLLSGQPIPNLPTTLAAYDVHSGQYVVLTAVSLEDLRYLFNESYLNSFPTKGFTRCLLQREQLLFQSPSLTETVSFIQERMI